MVGVTRNNNTVDADLLHSIARRELNEMCPRVMGVYTPLRVVIVNYDTLPKSGIYIILYYATPIPSTISHLYLTSTLPYLRRGVCDT